MSDTDERDLSAGDGEAAAERWAARLEEAPDIDIDYWTLLMEARILQRG